MADKVIDSFPIGAGKLIPVDHTGPASYTAGGETLGVTNNLTGITTLGFGTLDMVIGSDNLSVSGNYRVRVQPSGAGVQKTSKLIWYNAGSGTPAVGTPLTLGPISVAATQSAMTANGVVTVTGANTLKAGQFILLTNGATNVGIFMNGSIQQVVSATATSYTFNFAAAKALTYAAAADTLKFQVVNGGTTGNPVTLGTATGQSVVVTGVAVASNVLTITCVNTGITIVPGNFIVVQGLVAGEVPQGAIVQVLTATATTITANLIAPNLGVTNSETATAKVLVTNGNAPINASQDSFTISGTTVAATAASATAAGAITVLPVTQNLTAGNLVVVQGLTHGSTLNGLITPVLAASLTATNVTTNGFILAAVTTGSADLGALALLTTGIPAGVGDVAAGTNLSAETVRIGYVGR